MTSVKVSHVARYLLALSAGKAGEMGSISPLKLQKLVYYAQGYHLAMTREPLFAEPIQGVGPRTGGARALSSIQDFRSPADSAG